MVTISSIIFNQSIGVYADDHNTLKRGPTDPVFLCGYWMLSIEKGSQLAIKNGVEKCLYSTIKISFEICVWVGAARDGAHYPHGSDRLNDMSFWIHKFCFSCFMAENDIILS